MKQLKYFLLVAAVFLSIVGCRKTIEVSFENATQELGVQGGTIELALKSNGAWAIGPTEDWITVEPMSGEGDATLTLVAEPNTSGEPRSAKITATTKDNTAELTVTQNAAVYYLYVTPKEILCGSDGGEYTVLVSSNVEWSVITPEWIECSVTEGANDATVTLTISPMGDEIVESRMDDVIFGKPFSSTGSNTLTDKVHVVQSADPIADIMLTPNSLRFACTGETKTVAISTEDGWTASVEDDWVTLSQTEGEGDEVISVTVGENPIYVDRLSVVHFVTTGGIEKELSIRQDATPDPHFLEVSPRVVEFGKEGGEREILIGCDTNWQLASDSDWLSISQQSGTGNATVVLTAEQNESNELRSAELIIKSGALSCVIAVNQAPGDIPVVAFFVPDSLFVSYIGGLKHVQLTSNISWQLQTSNWISLVTDTSGEGDYSFDIIVDNNADSNDRIGYVNAVHDGQVMASLVVVQEGKQNILETDVAQLDVRPEGGEYVVHVTANQGWSLSLSADWFHCSPLSGMGNGSFTITVDALPSNRPRAGRIKVTGSTGSYVVISINQQ